MEKARGIALIVFDWAGTTTDYGSQAPLKAFDKVFTRHGVHFTKDEINAPMGMEKKDHLRAMLAAENGCRRWREARGRPWNEEDIDALYLTFEETLRSMVAEYSRPLPFVPETIASLRAAGVKIGSTTGYTSEMMRYVRPVAAEYGYEPDCCVTPDQTGTGRPGPFLLFECMRLLGVYPPSRVVKVGDTRMDIMEGKNGGAWAVGVLAGSNLLGYSEAEYAEADPGEIAKRKKWAAGEYLAAGADWVIDSIRELPALVHDIDARLAARPGEERA